MRNKNRNTTLIFLGSVATTSLPIVATVSCHTTSKTVSDLANKIGFSNWNEITNTSANLLWISKNPNLTSEEVYNQICPNGSNKVDVEKFNQLVQIPIDVLSTGSKIQILSCEKDLNDTSRLKVSFRIRKGKAVSEKKYNYIVGFKKPISEKNQEDVDNAFDKFKTVELFTTPNAVNELVTNVNVTNLNLYVKGLNDYFYVPHNVSEDSLEDNSLKLYATEILITNNPIDYIVDNQYANISVTFQYRKGTAVSSLITKNIVGSFKCTWSQNYEDVATLVKDYNVDKLSVSEVGKSKFATSINTNNIFENIQGFPTSSELNGAKIVFTEDGFSADDALGILSISFYYKKGNVHSKRLFKTIKGFVINHNLTPQFQEQNFLQSANEIKLFANDKAKNITSFYVNEQNITDYVYGFRTTGGWSYNVIDLKAIDDEASLKVILDVSWDDMKTTRIERVVSGFKSRTQQANENFEITVKEYQNIINNINKSFECSRFLTRDLAGPASSLVGTQLFNRPYAKRNVEVEYKVYYSKTRPTLNNTSLEVDWIIRNKITGNSQTVTTILKDMFRDPYQFLWDFRDTKDVIVGYMTFKNLGANGQENIKENTYEGIRRTSNIVYEEMWPLKRALNQEIWWKELVADVITWMFERGYAPGLRVKADVQSVFRENSWEPKTGIPDRKLGTNAVQVYSRVKTEVYCDGYESIKDFWFTFAGRFKDFYV